MIPPALFGVQDVVAQTEAVGFWLSSESKSVNRTLAAVREQMNRVSLALGLEEQRLALIKRYLAEFRKVVPPVKAARWYQAEMGLNRVVDIRLAAELPLLK